ncbi:caspase family protein [Caulobacter sp. NIBR1757]|uniref:caspase family protein n=1 Tax=Caulobacter sp. NIBR1757 TaxID=3016000 RepID=UPI0022F03BBC|nr:caspase family protein [Caulobacter sp. NIBR1757]WGM39775.1 hypothetical protein AMEJIAPC_02702 [Caulobacter sp. NIBR1757]
MVKTLKVLCVHGLGDHRTSTWETDWPAAIKAAMGPIPGLELAFEFVTYDDIFEKYEPNAIEVVKAAVKLGWSGIAGPRTKAFGLGDIADKVHWTAGYVVAWTENKTFQEETRAKMLAAVRQHQPDIILAHSLGTMVTYNAFSHAAAKEPDIAPLLAKAKYVTFGSQIGNRFVLRNLTNGRVQPLAVKFWHHLFNKHDGVFTAQIKLPGVANFRQTDTPFDDPDVMDHSATSYFRHPSTVADVWRPMAAQALGAKDFGAARMARALASRPVRKPVRKALLVGINEYPDPANRLEGCVNDVFTMSSVLQDCGFKPEEIRVCLDERATAQGILDRMAWLLEGANPLDELVFYYSGHGARIPEYGENQEPDHHVESLVPWDFDWTPERSITDDQIYCLYSQLPYDTRLMLFFDCCQSGGIHREGGRRARGITPPDDIRHRELKWDSRSQMWVQRDFLPLNRDFTKDKAVEAEFFGNNAATERLGRASMLRGLGQKDYSSLKRTDPELARGPYLPLIIEACREDQLSYEYRHGASSQGAFTFSLAQILRKPRKGGITFDQLVAETRKQLKYLQYDQEPQILGPSHIVKAKVPWLAGG